YAANGHKERQDDQAEAMPGQGARSTTAYGLQAFRRLSGRCRIAPFWRLGAIAPLARPVERVDAKLVHAGHLAHPARSHPRGGIVRRLTHFRQPELAIEYKR